MKGIKLFWACVAVATTGAILAAVPLGTFGSQVLAVDHPETTEIHYPMNAGSGEDGTIIEDKDSREASKTDAFDPDGDIPTGGELSASSVIYSPYASTPPTIDGLLSTDEWGSPAITKTLSYTHNITHESETHEMTVYFMNNHCYLYTAIRVTDDDFEGEDYQMGEDVDVIELYFDNDNDGVIEAYEDIKNFWNLEYRDWFKVGGEYRWRDEIGRAHV